MEQSLRNKNVNIMPIFKKGSKCKADIIRSSRCNLDVFADDTKIYSIIESECDAIELQRNLDKAQEWSI